VIVPYAARKGLPSSGASGVGALHALGVTTQKRIPNPFARDFVPDNLWKAYASPYVKYGTMGKKTAINC
jgi:hypothetical protein